MDKPIPIPEDWFDELKGRPYGERELSMMRSLTSVIHTAQIVMRNIPERYKSTRKVDIMDTIATHYFTHTYHIAEAVYNLCLKGYGPAALMLTRPMLEYEIDFAYLWLCKKIHKCDDERYAWLEYDTIDIDKFWRARMEEQERRKKYGLRLINDLPDESTSEQIRNGAESFKTKYGREHWARITVLVDRAKKVDQLGDFRERTETETLLEELYNLCYKLPSQAIHGSSGSSRLYATETDGVITINPRPMNFISESSAMAAQFLLHVTFLANHILRTGINLPKQLEASGFPKNAPTST